VQTNLVDGEIVKELAGISERNGRLRTQADRFGAAGDSLVQNRTIQNNQGQERQRVVR
jgi:hypothetical protein